MSTTQVDFITPAEYLAIERAAETKSEYVDGRMYAMSGASRRHNLIAGNLLSSLSRQLRGRPCEVYIADMRVKVSASGMYTYPDVVAVCGEPKFEDSFVDTLLNPTVIVEVVSPSTEDYDRGKKFWRYRTIDSLQQYVLVSQSAMHVDHYLRDANEWRLAEVTDRDGVLRLPSIACEIQLADIYERVDFNLPEQPRVP